MVRRVLTTLDENISLIFLARVQHSNLSRLDTKAKFRTDVFINTKMTVGARLIEEVSINPDALFSVFL